MLIEAVKALWALLVKVSLGLQSFAQLVVPLTPSIGCIIFTLPTTSLPGPLLHTADEFSDMPVNSIRIAKRGPGNIAPNGRNCSYPWNDQCLRYSTESALEAQFSPYCQIPPVYLNTFPSSKLSICVQSSYSPSRGQKMALFSTCNWLSRTLRSLTGPFGKMAMAITQLY